MKYRIYIYITLSAMIIVDILRYLSWVEENIKGGYNTYISIFLIYLSLCVFTIIALKSNWKRDNPTSIVNIFKLWLIVNSFNFVKGIFLAKDYWDYKFLFFSAVSFSFICLVFFIGNNLNYAQIVIRFTLKYIFPFGFLLIPLTLTTNEELYSRIMIPVSLFILFIPFLKFKYKVLVVLVTITSILLVISFRSNIIKIVFSLILLLLYYFKVNNRWLSFFNFGLFLLPIVFLTTAIFADFNIFDSIEKSNSYEVSNNYGTTENLNTDTRTFLYVEVLQTIKKNENLLFGSGSSSAYHSDAFYDTGGAMKGKRYGCEVAILNILLRYGLIGVFIYFLLLFKVSIIAINHSSNQLSKVLGLFIAFRWLYSFVEEFTQFDLNFYFFWLAIGLVSSTKFRLMNDKQIHMFFMKVTEQKINIDGYNSKFN